MLAAEVPDTPEPPTFVSQSPTQIVIRWVAPYDRGTPIRDYEVYWDQAFGSYIMLEPTT